MLLLAIVLLFAWRKVSAGVRGGQLDVTSSENIVYRGAGDLWDILDNGLVDNSSGSIGTALYDFFHGVN